MKKLITTVGIALGLVAPASSSTSEGLTVFESVLYGSKKTGSLMPVWEPFVNTQFFVVVLRNDSGEKTKDFRFSIFHNPVDNKPYVLIAEKLERLENPQNEGAIKLTGAQIIQTINQKLGIIIKLRTEDGAFAIPHEQVQWLLDSIQSNEK